MLQTNISDIKMNNKSLKRKMVVSLQVIKKQQKW